MSNFEFPLMRKAGSLLAEVACIVHEATVPGMTPLRLDEIAEREIRARKCLPAFKGYRGFEHTICVSVNHCVVHGIPDNRKFEIDDVVSVDMGLSFGGYFADMAFTEVLGTNPDSWRLKSAVRTALQAGFAAARPGNRTGDIGAAIQQVAESRGLGIVTALVGHGIGRALHEQPPVPNFGRAGKGQLLKPGMALAIEPMFTLGSGVVDTLPDGWAVVTRDGSLAAHYEHTLLITDTGPELLTF